MGKALVVPLRMEWREPSAKLERSSEGGEEDDADCADDGEREERFRACSLIAVAIEFAPFCEYQEAESCREDQSEVGAERRVQASIVSPPLGSVRHADYEKIIRALHLVYECFTIRALVAMSIG